MISKRITAAFLLTSHKDCQKHCTVLPSTYFNLAVQFSGSLFCNIMSVCMCVTASKLEWRWASVSLKTVRSQIREQQRGVAWDKKRPKSCSQRSETQSCSAWPSTAFTNESGGVSQYWRLSVNFWSPYLDSRALKYKCFSTDAVVVGWGEMHDGSQVHRIHIWWILDEMGRASTLSKLGVCLAGCGLRNVNLSWQPSITSARVQAGKERKEKVCYVAWWRKPC